MKKKISELRKLQMKFFLQSLKKQDYFKFIIIIIGEAKKGIILLNFVRIWYQYSYSLSL